MTSPKIIQEIGSKVSYTEAQSLTNEQKTQVRTNIGAVDNSSVVSITGTQTISGAKTFSASPVVPTPNADDDSQNAVNTAWINDILESDITAFEGIASGQDPTNEPLLQPSNIVTVNGAQTITGIKTFSRDIIASAAIRKSATTGITDVRGGTDNTNGAYVRLYGGTRSANAGEWVVGASDGTNTKLLSGKPDGTLTWGGNPILTSANGVTLDTAQTITGEKTIGTTLYNTDGAVSKTTTRGVIRMRGGTTASTGAYSGLYGSDHATFPGMFELLTGPVDSYPARPFKGYPDGRLTWDSKEIERVNAVDTTSKYIRYQSGFQVIFGTTTIAKDTTETTVTLPIPFASRTSYSISFAQTNNDEIIPYAGTTTDYTATSFKLTHSSATANRYIRWIAVGFGTPE